MAEEYKVELGIGLNEKQLSSIRTTIDNLVKEERKIDLNIDFKIKNAQVLANAGKEIEELKLKLDELGSINLAKKGKSAIPINTESVEKSIKNINESIKKLQNAFGRVDKNRGVQSLLTTVSKISVELTNVSKQFSELNKNLSSLSSKDFSINFGFDLGSNKKDPEQLMKELRVLEKEAREYENYFYKILNKTNRFDEKNARSSIYHLANKVGKSDSKNYLLTLDKAMASESDVTKVAAYKQYIKTIKEFAEIGGYSIASVEARLADSTGFNKLQNEANETEEKLKQLFSGGIDATKLHETLENIAESLKEIKRSASALSDSLSADGLTESFNKLSDSLKEVFDNYTLVKNNIDNISNAGTSAGNVNGIENLENDLKQVENAAEKASDSIRETVNESKKLNNISVDISDDGIDELKNSLRSIGADEDIIERITNEITNMGIVAKNVSGTLKEGDLVKFDVQGIQKTEDGLERIITLTKTLNDGSWLNSESYTQSINNDFEELKRRAKEISNLRIDILNSDDVSDINRMSIELNKLNKEFDELYANTKSGLNSRQISQLDNLVNQGDAKVIKEFNSELSEFVKLQNQIENTRFEIGKLEVVGGKDNEIVELKRQLEELEDTYNRLMNTFMKKATANGDIIKLDDFKNLENGITTATVNAENRLERFKSQYADTRAELERNIKVDIELGNFDDDVSRMQDKFDKLSHASKDLYDSVDNVNDALNRMKEASKLNSDGIVDTERLIKAQQDYARAIEKTNNLIDQQTRKEAAEARSQKLIDDRQIFQSKIDSWLTKNSAATVEFGKKMLDLKAKAENCDRVTLNHLQKQFTKLDNAADKAGLKMESFGDGIKKKLKEYSTYFSVAEVFMYITQGLKDMFEQVKLIDSAMTELKKVTNETDAAYNQFLSNAASRAKEIGTTIDGLVSSTADFARLGYGFRESQGLAEVANIYAVVGDDIDNVESATQSLISTLTAFKNEANGLSDDDFALSIVDKMNEVSNNFAISSGGIGEALQRSASSMMAANNSLDETIALITAANTVVQDPDTVGRLMPTLKVAISVKLLRRTRPRKDFIL